MFTKINLYENFNVKSDEDKTNVAVKVLHILSQFQIFHWQTPKMSSHKTFDDFTEDFKEIGDKLIEVIQGKYGRIELTDDISLPIRNIQEIEPYQFTENCIDFFNVCKSNIFSEDDEIISIIDEIVANLQQLKYLLSFDTND